MNRGVFLSNQIVEPSSRSSDITKANVLFSIISILKSMVTQALQMCKIERIKLRDREQKEGAKEIISIRWLSTSYNIKPMALN